MSESTKRRLETLTNEELSSILALRNRKLECWLKTELVAAEGADARRTVWYMSACKPSLAVMECLLEIEARAKPCSKWDTPYLPGSKSKGE